MFAEMGMQIGQAFGGLARAAGTAKYMEEKKNTSIARRMEEELTLLQDMELKRNKAFTKRLEAEAKLLNAQNASRRLDLREMETAPPQYVMIDGARPQIEPQ